MPNIMHDYENPNTCYAIGDSFSVYLGTATEDRQPASGVFEELSAIIKNGTTDMLGFWDGTDNVGIVEAGFITSGDIVDAVQAGAQSYNMAIKIGNTVYIRKFGTTDRIAVSGVQIDA